MRYWVLTIWSHGCFYCSAVRTSEMSLSGPYLHTCLCWLQDEFNDLNDLESSLASFPIKPLQALKYDFSFAPWPFFLNLLIDLQSDWSVIPNNFLPSNFLYAVFIIATAYLPRAPRIYLLRGTLRKKSSLFCWFFFIYLSAYPMQGLFWCWWRRWGW